MVIFGLCGVLCRSLLQTSLPKAESHPFHNAPSYRRHAVLCLYLTITHTQPNQPIHFTEPATITTTPHLDGSDNPPTQSLLPPPSPPTNRDGQVSRQLPSSLHISSAAHSMLITPSHDHSHFVSFYATPIQRRFNPLYQDRKIP
jgi:hypothetical protein